MCDREEVEVVFSVAPWLMTEYLGSPPDTYYVYKRSVSHSGKLAPYLLLHVPLHLKRYLCQEQK